MEQNPNYGVTCDWFKTLLDPANLEIQKQQQGIHESTTHEDVRRWYRDYFLNLYCHIEQELFSALANFEWSKQRSILFSVPTTWNHNLVEEFRNLVHEGGFGGREELHHTVTMSLTEAEAAAVHVATESPDIFKKGDVLVVCDAGGGTTDLSALEVTEDMGKSSSFKRLKQVDVVGGENIGSVGIDLGFEKRAQARLQWANDIKPLGIDIEEAAWEMAKHAEFQNVKCEHGAPSETPKFFVPVPNLTLQYRNDHAAISDGHMTFEQGELRDQFDVQIERLFRLIDRQLRSLLAKLPDQQQISHLVLSGGLGRSKHVQQRLIEHYRSNSDLLVNTCDMVVKIAPDPQLAVCKGIVADRLSKLKAGQSILGWRCCRASYGVICRELYDSKRHIGRPTAMDVQDNRVYVDNCVEWFVIQGTPVSVDRPISREFFRKIRPGLTNKRFPTRIAVSYVNRSVLPGYIEPGVEKLCEVEADLSFADEKSFKEKNKHFWQPGAPLLEVRFTVKVVIGPADIHFKLCKSQSGTFRTEDRYSVAGFDNQKISGQNSIKVEWAPVTTPPSAIVEPPVPFAGKEHNDLAKKKLKEKPSRRRWKGFLGPTLP